MRTTLLVGTTMLSVLLMASAGSCAGAGDVLGTQFIAVEAAGNFHAASGRWPESETELRQAAEQEGMKLGPEKVAVTPQPDGRLRIHVTSGSCLLRATSDAYLSPPDSDGKVRVSAE